MIREREPFGWLVTQYLGNRFSAEQLCFFRWVLYKSIISSGKEAPIYFVVKKRMESRAKGLQSPPSVKKLRGGLLLLP